MNTCLNYEDERATFLKNFINHLCNDAVLYSRRPEFSLRCRSNVSSYTPDPASVSCVMSRDNCITIVRSSLDHRTTIQAVENSSGQR